MDRFNSGRLTVLLKTFEIHQLKCTAFRTAPVQLDIALPETLRNTDHSPPGVVPGRLSSLIHFEFAIL